MTNRRTHPGLALLIALSIAGAAAGCASQGTGAAASKALAPLVLPSRSGPALDVSAAGLRYEEIITPRNEDINAIGYAVEAGRPWTDVRTLVAKIFQDNDAEARDLASTAWPKDVSPWVDKLVHYDLAQRQRWSDAATAITESDFDARLKAAWSGPDGEQDAATNIRQLLGLGGQGHAPPLSSTAARI